MLLDLKEMIHGYDIDEPEEFGESHPPEYRHQEQEDEALGRNLANIFVAGIAIAHWSDSGGNGGGDL